MGTVVITGVCNGTGLTKSAARCSFRFEPEAQANPPGMPQKSARQQQIPNISRNHAHHGQPPPSVVVAVVVVDVTALAATVSATTVADLRSSMAHE
mmetsp:Transcript_51234/g.136764  ORF Transcript_51234/g.136764 Transcript_51234/m.136764 type:complete len:96 (-) Transcript_51234:41-328(-)